jgi:hypothetical protein
MTPTQATYNDIVARAATLCNVNPYDAHHVRSRECGRARYIAWYVMSFHLGWKQTEIAMHTTYSRLTVRYGIELIGDQRSRSEDGQIVQALVESLKC